jgi:hypothetical protein
MFGRVQLRELGEQGTAGVADIINDSPEAFIGWPATLLNVRDRGAVTERALGELTLGQAGSLPEVREMLTQRSATGNDLL